MDNGSCSKTSNNKFLDVHLEWMTPVTSQIIALTVI